MLEAEVEVVASSKFKLLKFGRVAEDDFWFSDPSLLMVVFDSSTVSWMLEAEEVDF